MAEVKSLSINGDDVVDYIIDQGSNGTWYYRKWSSGLAECWTIGNKLLTGIIEPIALLGGYYTYAEINLPFTFTSVHTAIASARLGTGVGSCCTTWSETHVAIHCVGNQNSTAITFCCRVTGTWK